MKKVLIAVFVLSLAVSNAMAKISVKASFDEGRTEGAGNNGFSLSGEYIWSFGRIFSLGIGAEYILPRKVKTSSLTDISFLPLYTMVKVKIPKANIYGKTNIGWSVFANVDDHVVNGQFYDHTEGGLYISESIGYEHPKGFFIEFGYEICGYSYNHTSFHPRYYTDNHSNSFDKTYLGIGYLF
ncbi:MAG: hypothetical protein LBH29_06385 [Elusimicrobiota bacterium]|jgi:hypothetical protein|nr:hypothetical protein [Elusimicrobiota bacterium]